MFRLSNKFENCILDESMNEDSNGRTEHIKEKQEIEKENDQLKFKQDESKDEHQQEKDEESFL